MTTFPSLVSPACACPMPSKTAWQEPKQFLQSALDALSAHIAILDEHGTIIEVNAGWIRFACENDFKGVRSGVGDDYLQVCDSASGPASEGASAVAIGIRAVMAGQSNEFYLEYPCHSPGEERWFIVRATRFADEGRVRVVVAHENTTERKHAAQQLSELKLNEERSRRALEHERELNQIKSRFVSMVSHEFRTPLCVIGMAGSLLRLYADRMTAAERSKQIQGIQAGVERMTQMMEDLLLHGEFETGKVECKPVPVDVAALCQQTISEVSKQATALRAIESVIDPAASKAVLDPKILRHILGNLLSNALKYSSEGQSVVLKVTHSTGHAPAEGDTKTQTADQLQLTVIDSGIGIPVADLSKLFQAFKRASNVGNRPGTGMGLAIVKQFVDIHGGTIRIESTEGKGTSVSVWLPIASPAGAGFSLSPAGSERTAAGTAIPPEIKLVEFAKP